MTHSPRPSLSSLAAFLIVCGGMLCSSPLDTERPTPKVSALAEQLIGKQPGVFVPNLGQWDRSAKFVHRSGAMTMFLKDRGWVLEVAESRTRGMALHMTFEAYFPRNRFVVFGGAAERDGDPR